MNKLHILFGLPLYLIAMSPSPVASITPQEAENKLIAAEQTIIDDGKNISTALNEKASELGLSNAPQDLFKKISKYGQGNDLIDHAKVLASLVNLILYEEENDTPNFRLTLMNNIGNRDKETYARNGEYSKHFNEQFKKQFGEPYEYQLPWEKHRLYAAYISLCVVSMGAFLIHHKKIGALSIPLIGKSLVAQFARWVVGLGLPGLVGLKYGLDIFFDYSRLKQRKMSLRNFAAEMKKITELYAQKLRELNVARIRNPLAVGKPHCEEYKEAKDSLDLFLSTMYETAKNLKMKLKNSEDIDPSWEVVKINTDT